MYIEQAQNVRNYLARKRFTDASHANAIIVIGRQEEHYVVSSGNIVEEEDAGSLTDRLEALKALDAEGLRRMFKERLRAEHRGPGSGGAGVGLIEIARRCAEPLQYSFRTVDAAHTLLLPDRRRVKGGGWTCNIARTKSTP